MIMKLVTVALTATIIGCGTFTFSAYAADAMLATRAASSPDDVVEALRGMRERGVIALRTGVYDALVIDGIRSGVRITISAQDPANPPVLRRVVVNDSSNLTFDNMIFSPDPVSVDRAALQVAKSQNIEIRRSVFRAARDTPSERRLQALFVEDVEGLTITDNRIEDLDRGLVMQRARRVDVVHNSFRQLGTGAIDFAAVDGLEVRANRFGGFNSEKSRTGAFIRSFTRGASLPTSNVRIADNVMIQDTDVIADAVMFTNEDRLPYRNINIVNNIIVIAGPHGVTVDRGTDVVVERNAVIDAQRSSFNSAIRMSRIEKGSMSKNVATAFAVTNSQDVVRRLNSTVPRMDERARSTYFERVREGLASSSDSRILGMSNVTAAHRASGPRP